VASTERDKRLRTEWPRDWGTTQQTLGFWKAAREVFPATKEHRCWFHKQSNVFAALPKSAHPATLAAVKDIYNAEDIDKAQVAVKAFEIDFGAEHPKVVAKIVDDLDTLLEFYHCRDEHWIYLRTRNPIESTFATVRLRTKVTKGPGSRAAGLTMAYKLIDAAQARWRAVNAPHLVALVRAGAIFRNGKLLERPTDITPPQPPSDGGPASRNGGRLTPSPQESTIALCCNEFHSSPSPDAIRARNLCPTKAV
jgi:Transposase, Mutator family